MSDSTSVEEEHAERLTTGPFEEQIRVRHSFYTSFPSV